MAFSVADGRFFVARQFYYAGMVTICLTSVRPGSAITVSDWFFLGSLLLAGLESVLSRRIDMHLPATLCVGLLVFSIGAALAALQSPDQQSSIFWLGKYLYLVGVWFWLGTVVLRSSAQVLVATKMWVWSACILGTGAVIQFFFGDVVPGASPPVQGRMTGFSEHINDLGGAAAVALIPAIMIATAKGRDGFLFWHLVLIGVMAGLVLSVSLTGIGAALVAYLVWRVLASAVWGNLVRAAVFVALATGIYSTFGTELRLLNRLVILSEEGSQLATISSRLDTYQAALVEINSNPLMGAGLGQKTETGMLVHNFFLSSWYETGAIGFFGMCMVLVSISSVAWRMLRQPDAAMYRVVAALSSSFAAFLVLGMGQPVYYKRFGWVGAALLLALCAVHRRNSLSTGEDT